jgi:hypothetical protein
MKGHGRRAAAIPEQNQGNCDLSNFLQGRRSLGWRRLDGAAPGYIHPGFAVARFSEQSENIFPSILFESGGVAARLDVGW